MSRIGFLINPIAGMGGRVGLKGTDGVVERAIALGARPVAPMKAAEALTRLRELSEQAGHHHAIDWITCAGAMGADALKEAGFTSLEIAYEAAGETSAQDTAEAVTCFLDRNVELIFFCGGDGTARDVCRVAKKTVPILGIPAGVKMYSGVFGASPAKTAEILISYLEGKLALASVEILDLDEEKYRRGEWAVRLCDAARTPFEASLTQAAKMLIAESSDSEVKAEIADFLRDEFAANPHCLVLLGPGSTVQSIGRAFGIEKTLLGVDAMVDGTLVGRDLNEARILELIGRYPEHKLVLSPIGAQGFVLGRGNLQLSPEVVRLIGASNIIVAATPAKLARTPMLRFDTGDAELDAALAGKGYLPVVIGYGRRRLVKTAA